ncbi:hypothetical protein CSUI_006187 [Cystoisospora suis]|uniref:Uncharacterized protein n=1 Tax=Cystoisospora suis TaxID=483139 RepID=A0A2C6KVA1_9APIC|nr:hypothetical protein CSUI_006187 [Cystoisospora suis]
MSGTMAGASSARGSPPLSRKTPDHYMYLLMQLSRQKAAAERAKDSAGRSVLRDAVPPPSPVDAGVSTQNRTCQRETERPLVLPKTRLEDVSLGDVVNDCEGQSTLRQQDLVQGKIKGEPTSDDFYAGQSSPGSVGKTGCHTMPGPTQWPSDSAGQSARRPPSGNSDTLHKQDAAEASFDNLTGMYSDFGHFSRCQPTGDRLCSDSAHLSHVPESHTSKATAVPLDQPAATGRSTPAVPEYAAPRSLSSTKRGDGRCCAEAARCTSLEDSRTVPRPHKYSGWGECEKDLAHCQQRGREEDCGCRGGAGENSDGAGDCERYEKERPQNASQPTPPQPNQVHNCMWEHPASIQQLVDAIAGGCGNRNKFSFNCQRIYCTRPGRHCASCPAARAQHMSDTKPRSTPVLAEVRRLQLENLLRLGRRSCHVSAYEKTVELRLTNECRSRSLSLPPRIEGRDSWQPSWEPTELEPKSKTLHLPLPPWPQSDDPVYDWEPQPLERECEFSRSWNDVDPPLHCRHHLKSGKTPRSSQSSSCPPGSAGSGHQSHLRKCGSRKCRHRVERCFSGSGGSLLSSDEPRDKYTGHNDPGCRVSSSADRATDNSIKTDVSFAQQMRGMAEGLRDAVCSVAPLRCYNE